MYLKNDKRMLCLENVFLLRKPIRKDSCGSGETISPIQTTITQLSVAALQNMTQFS